MKVLITGIKDQLGHSAVNELAPRGIEGIDIDMEEVDITSRIVHETVISQEKPDTVIHCATYTAVDATENSLGLCRRINTEGMCNITRVHGAMNIEVMHISADYVLNGDDQRPWESDDHRGSLDVYGPTKYGGEVAVEQGIQEYFIVHIAWVFSVDGKSFIKTILHLEEEKGAVSVVSNQIGSSIYTYDPARLLVDVIRTDKHGRYHAINEELCNWYEFTCEVSYQADMNEVKVTPVDSDGFPAKAERPSNGRTGKERLAEDDFEHLLSWQDALGRYLKVLKENRVA